MLAAEKGPIEKNTDGGYEEFEIRLRFFVQSDDRDVIEAERERLFCALPDAALDLTA